MTGRNGIDFLGHTFAGMSRSITFLLLVLVSLAGCGDHAEREGPGRIEITPPAARLAIGSSLAASAAVYGADGQLLPEPSATWSSSAAGVASVSASGVVTGLSAGGATIDATVDDLHASLALTVAPAARINLASRSNVMAPGASMTVRASTLDVQNLPLTADLDWSSSDPAVLTVKAGGIIQAQAPGVAVVRSTTAGITGQLSIAVQAPTHGRIAFVSRREPASGTPPTASGGIYLMNADGTDVRLRVADARIGCNPDLPGRAPFCVFPTIQPALAADGMRLAAVVSTLWEIEYAPVHVILICAIDQPTCMQLDFPSQTRPPGPRVMLMGVASPAWSPDGGRLAFASGNGHLTVWDLEAATFTDIDLGSVTAPEPTWSPDGSRIAVAIARTQTESAIWTMNPDGTARTCLCASPANDSHPAWSPDGMRIAFVRTVASDSEIYVMNADGSGATNLTQDPAQDGSPSWSTDGTQIAFETNRDGNWEIYVMNADGSGPTNLTRNPADDRSPSWGP